MFLTTLLHTEHHSEGFGAIFHHLLEDWGLNHQWTEFITHLLVDCIEVMGLLILVMTAVFFLQSYVDFNRLKEKMARLQSIWGYGLAIILGMLSPFCSCSIIPLMIGLLSMKVPLSVCMCMLTSASLLNLTALLGISALLGEFLFQYITASLLVIVGSSALIAQLHLDPVDLRLEKGQEHGHSEDCHDGCCHDEVHGHSNTMPFVHRLVHSFFNAWTVLKGAALYIVLGVALSAALTSFFDMEHIVGFVRENSVLSVVLAGLIGFPIHSDLFSALPVLRLLLEISPATALTFALSTMSISIPSMVLLSRILRPKTIAIYAGSLLLFALSFGWILLIF